MSPTNNHYDEMTVLLYHEGQLDAGYADEVSAHLASCAACRALLHALEAEAVWLREAFTAHEESIPARLIEAPGRRTAHWGWIIAFALSAGGVYTLWSSFVDPWLAQAQQAGFTQGSLLTMLFFTGAFSKGWDAMRTVMEFLAMATLGSVVIWLLRKHWKRFPMVAAVMGALACALALPPSAGAAEVKRGDPSYTLPAGQEVKTDLIVWAARTRIERHASVTPVYGSETLGRETGRPTLLKAENLQRTGSFKIRGAVNKIATLSDRERRAGRVAASPGNHGQAVAWAAREVGAAARIFMPQDAPMAKVDATRSYGAEVELGGPALEDALEAAYQNALRLFKRGNLEAAMDGLLDIMRQDKRYRNGEVHKVVLGILELISADETTVRQYRNELASILF